MVEIPDIQTRRVWFYSYTWESDPGGWRHFDQAITDRHPLFVFAEWQDEYDGNQRSRLLWFQEITGDLDDPNLDAYIDFSLSANYGELGGLKDVAS